MTTATVKHLLKLPPLLLALFLPSAQPGHAEADLLEHCRDLSTDELDAVRGGYLTDNGLELAFGVLKTIQINGIPVAVSTITLGDQASSLAERNTTLLQNGPGNGIDPGLIAGAQPGTFTLIQNSLDRAVIQNMTRIDATVTVRNLYRDLNLASQLTRQLIGVMH